MPDIDLEEVKKLAEQLSPDERQVLLNFLAELPDSGWSTLEPTPLALDGAKEYQPTTVDGDQYVVVATDKMARLLLKERVIFEIVYYPENYQQSRMEIRSWQNSPPDGAVEQVAGILKLYGNSDEDIAKMDLVELCKQSTAKVYEVETERITREISVRLPHMICLLFDAGVKIIEFGIRGMMAEHEGSPKKPLDKMVKELEPYWKQIKAHLGVTAGGRRTVKHKWTILDHTCLALHYMRLQPIWREAKKAAKEAQNSREPTRRKRWKEAVAAVYQDDALPSDLIDQLTLPQSVPPADLALLHASRICLPGTSYSLKILKAKLRQFKPPPPPKPSAEPPS